MIHALKVPQYYAVEDLTCLILESLTGSKDLLLSDNLCRIQGSKFFRVEWKFRGQFIYAWKPVLNSVVCPGTSR